MNAIELNVSEAQNAITTDTTSLVNLNDMQLALVGGGNADISLN